MHDPIEKRVFDWDQSGQHDFREINRKINHLEKRLFYDYEPNQGPNTNFMSKLNVWLNNLNDEADQQTLFRLVPNLFYVGREEFNVLYREAYHTVFARWIIEVSGIDIYSRQAKDDIRRIVSETWFCPLTDSLRINQFYHVNDIPAKNDHRPDWRSLVEFGDDDKIKNYVKKHNIKQIVLLEDFIGNGTQVAKAANLAVRLFPGMPILVIPLIICPGGVKNTKALTEQYSNVAIMPVIAMSDQSFINDKIKGDGSKLCCDTYDLAVKSYEQVSNSAVIDEKSDPYGPFGWKRTGGLIITYSNAPNNTLPLVHNVSKSWVPLFKRHKRV